MCLSPIKDNGKVVILADPEKIKHGRKRIVRMVAKVERGEMTKHDVDVHFKTWKSSVRYGNSHKLICRLNRWYESLWKGLKNYVHQKTQNGHRHGERF